MSDDHKQLKEEFELCVEKLKEDQADLDPNALNTMSSLVKASTTSMTSVPKPLKFMIPQFETMKAVRGARLFV